MAARSCTQLQPASLQACFLLKRVLRALPTTLHAHHSHYMHANTPGRKMSPAWFAGKRNDVAEIMRGLDIYVLPSLAEGISNTFLEAMASGLPLVVTNVPGNDDVVRDNDCGVIVKGKDPEAMAAGLHQLLSDDSYRSSLAVLSQQCSGKYDWLQVAAQYERVYQRSMHDHDNAEARNS